MPASNEVRDPEALGIEDLQETWRLLAPDDRIEAFRSLPRSEAEDFFLDLPARDQAELLSLMPAPDRRSWMRLLPPDDAADVVQVAEESEREALLGLLDEATRREVTALLAYAEDEAGGLMNPRYSRLRPEMTADEAIAYLRRQARERSETIYYNYVLDADQKLMGVISFRTLFSAPPSALVRDLMSHEVVTVTEDMDQEAVSRVFAQQDLMAIPVVDQQGHMKGIVTVDDIVDVVQEEATEDIQKIGGTAALGAPYLEVSMLGMVRKRAPWLGVLFLGEMLTATAMGRFEDQLARALVLSIFIPLIISSGGNSGSQASTLVIRAMALGEVRLSDWWRVIHREIAAGLALGGILGALGFGRVMLWQWMFQSYGDHGVVVGLTIAGSLLGVVTFGTFVGSMLPFLLRRLGADPASASAPFVATLVDVTGIVIYFTVASWILRGSLL
ncbi:MAG TPA: magnesium transporter [Candidatus Limnocylindria bacterium]|nr:magnesium transporter [Candidatus Limnocylindria bacterium]